MKFTVNQRKMYLLALGLLILAIVLVCAAVYFATLPLRRK